MRRRFVLKGLVAACAATSLSSLCGGAARAASASKNHHVEIKGLVFVPGRLAVKPGDKITWINRDIVIHTATAKDGSWDTGSLENGASHTLTVTEGMSGSYFCEFHPSMTAEIFVE